MLIKDVTLKRKRVGNYHNLFGRLRITTNQGIFHFSTIESYVHKINAGVYKVKYTYSPRFKKEMLHIFVPNRAGIRIHSANRGIELQGCIAIGVANTDDEATQIYFSKDSTDIVTSLLFDKEVNINIIDDYETKHTKKNRLSSIAEAIRFGA